MIGFIRKAWDEYLKERAKERDRREKYRIAAAFNGRMALETWGSWKFHGGKGRWMCPECLTVHATTGWGPLCGSEYPPCCSFRGGHVCWDSCAVPPWDNYRP